MGEFDLDARRAARREALGEAPAFRFEGERFELPVEMPLEALDAVAGVDVEGMTELQAVAVIRPLMAAMMGEEQYARFVALRPSLEDLVDVADYLWSAYGLTPQTPSAPTPPSRATTRRSKQTSNGSTRSASGKRSSAASVSAGSPG